MKTANESPMANRWRELKEQNPGCLVLFRMGDFYESFHDDAKILAAAVGLTLTQRDRNSANPIAMAGFPYHQLHNYLAKLVSDGHRVAVNDFSATAGKCVAQTTIHG